MAQLTTENLPKYRQKFWAVCGSKVRFDIYVGNWRQRKVLVEKFCYDNEQEALAKFNETRKDLFL